MIRDLMKAAATASTLNNFGSLLLILALVAAVLLIPLDLIVTTYDLFRVKNCTVSGKVTAAAIERSTSRQRRTYHEDITVKYHVRGKDYQIRRLYPGIDLIFLADHIGLRLYSSNRSGYRTGNKVTVHYNKDNPEDAFVAFGYSKITVAFAALLIAGTLFPFVKRTLGKYPRIAIFGKALIKSAVPVIVLMLATAPSYLSVGQLWILPVVWIAAGGLLAGLALIQMRLASRNSHS